MRKDAGLVELASAIDTIRATPFQDRPNEPRPSGYYGDLVGPPSPAQRAAVRTRLRYMRDVFAFGKVDPAGRDVVEAGSGFGVGLVTTACLGARSVTGVELVGWQADWARACVARLGMQDRITVHDGSVTEMPLPDSSADVVLSLEAISHYLDYQPFLAEARRVLRPGGTLIVSDGNNGLNPKIRRYTEALWASHETDPRTYVHDEADGEYNPWLLADHRHRIVLERQPGISDDDAWTIALNTAGAVRAEVEDAADAFVETGAHPNRPYVPGTLSVHPDHEMVMERLFDPWELGREIEGFGFRVRVRGHWAGASGKPAYRAADRVLGALSRATMATARGFRIAAVRTG